MPLTFFQFAMHYIREMSSFSPQLLLPLMMSVTAQRNVFIQSSVTPSSDDVCYCSEKCLHLVLSYSFL